MRVPANDAGLVFRRNVLNAASKKLQASLIPDDFKTSNPVCTCFAIDQSAARDPNMSPARQDQQPITWLHLDLLIFWTRGRRRKTIHWYLLRSTKTCYFYHKISSNAEACICGEIFALVTMFLLWVPFPVQTVYYFYLCAKSQADINLSLQITSMLTSNVIHRFASRLTTKRKKYFAGESPTSPNHEKPTIYALNPITKARLENQL